MRKKKSKPILKDAVLPPPNGMKTRNSTLLFYRSHDPTNDCCTELFQQGRRTEITHRRPVHLGLLFLNTSVNGPVLLTPTDNYQVQ